MWPSIGLMATSSGGVTTGYLSSRPCCRPLRSGPHASQQVKPWVRRLTMTITLFKAELIGVLVESITYGERV